MRGRHRRTLEVIFRGPVPGALEWAARWRAPRARPPGLVRRAWARSQRIDDSAVGRFNRMEGSAPGPRAPFVRIAARVASGGPVRPIAQLEGDVLDMHFKLIIAFVDDRHTEAVMQAARKSGATGITLLPSARGEGIEPAKTFLGLSLESRRDVLVLVVEEHLSRHILEGIAEAGGFERSPGRGIAVQLDVEDVVGASHQVRELAQVVEKEL